MNGFGFAAVIFDCDGVLIDSEVVSADTLIDCLAELGLTYSRADVFSRFTGRSFADVSADIERTDGCILAPTFERDYREALLSRFTQELKAVAGVETVLNQIAVPWCVATGSNPERARRSLELTGLWQRAHDRLITASMVRRGKPAPDLFLHAAELLRTKPHDCLVVEDSEAGIEAGLAAGMTVWRFTGGSHFRHGYGQKPLSQTPHRIFDAMSAFFEGIAEQDQLELHAIPFIGR